MTEPVTERTTKLAAGRDSAGLAGRALGALRSLVPARFRRDKPTVPVVRLTGVIGFSTPLRPGLSLAGIARVLDKAFAKQYGRRR